MNEIQNKVGKYIGKMLTDETNQYKKYKLIFECEGKKLNFKAFMPWTKKDGSEKVGVTPLQLEEGKWYKVGYIIYEGKFENGEVYKSKTAVSLFESQEEKSNVPAEVQIPQEEELLKIVQVYNENVSNEIKSMNHFIGTVLRTTNKDMFVDLEKVYEEKVNR